MPTDFLNPILSNLWAVFMVILLFGGSIFVHELGHFLAARRRGVKVERFSIGFGPAIWSHRGRDGVDYRISWFPLGGYVLLPQLADLGPLEGAVESDVSKLPPVSYATKMIVFVAGALFNILFAFALACIVWVIGKPVSSPLNSTTIAEVLPVVTNSDGREVPSPASLAKLKSGDVILAVDGQPVETFHQIIERLALSSGWTRSGERETNLTLRRDGKIVETAIQPVIGGPEKTRIIGITTVAKLEIGRITPQSAADKAGLKAGDVIIAVAGKPILTFFQLRTVLRAATGPTLPVTVLRGTQTESVTVALTPDPQKGADIGIAFKTAVIFAHPTPVEQIVDCLNTTFRALGALINPRSDIGFAHLSGPIGIITNFVDSSRAGLPFVLWFTILVNINLAIFNLLPLPVLDGGQMLFATIGRVRGRPLPVNFIMTAQSVFLVLLFSMVLYVSIFDVRRIVRDVKADRADSTPAPTPPPVAPPAQSAPAK